MNTHIKGPLTVGSAKGGYNACNLHGSDDGAVASVYGMPLHTPLDEVETLPRYAEGLATARLLAASYNAFDKAARTLGVDATQLAQTMSKPGTGIDELIRTLARAAQSLSEYAANEGMPKDALAEEISDKLNLLGITVTHQINLASSS